jgi:hypothetical protein
MYSLCGEVDLDLECGLEYSSELSESMSAPMRNPQVMHSASEYTQLLQTVCPHARFNEDSLDYYMFLHILH